MTRAPILPPLTRSAADAEALARVVHAGQVDQAGRPYIEHVDDVAHRALKLALDTPLVSLDEVQQIAWLHDVLEPDERPFGRVTRDDLEVEGFALNVVRGAASLTRGLVVRETYAEYIGSIARRSPLPVLLVKLADLEENSDPARIALLAPKRRASLLERYEPAKTVLREALALVMQQYKE